MQLNGTEKKSNKYRDQNFFAWLFLADDETMIGWKLLLIETIIDMLFRTIKLPDIERDREDLMKIVRWLEKYCVYVWIATDSI